MQHTICILCYNHQLFSKLCIDSVLQHTPVKELNAEIVVIDNGSRDGTKALLHSYGDRITVVSNKTNVGVFKAMNQGMLLRPGNSFTIVANDHIVTPKWFETLLTGFDEWGPGIYSPLAPHMHPWISVDRWNDLRNRHFKDKSDSTQSINTYLASLYPNGLDWFANKVLQADHHIFDKNWAWTGLQVIHPEVIERIGYIDERFGFFHGADIDYLWRAGGAGFRRAAVNSFVHHFGSITLRKQMGDVAEQPYYGEIKGREGTDAFLAKKEQLIKVHKINEYQLDGKVFRYSLK